MSNKTRLAKTKFANKLRVFNTDVAKTLAVGVTATERYMKPLGFNEDWEIRTDSKGQEYKAKVWVQ